jgi:hypothetical protein
MNAKGVLENFLDDFLWLKRHLDWGVLTYTFHPYVIGRGHRLMMLERLILKLIDNDAVFLPLEQAAAEFATR